MKHRKIFKDEDGSRYEIEIEICGSYSEKSINRMEVYKCEPGKRKFIPIASEYSDDWRYRSMSTEDQKAYRKKMFKDVVKYSWFISTLDELLDKMRAEYIKDWRD